MCYMRTDAANGSVDVTRGREVLPTNVKPVHYDLTLEPDLEKFTYEGTVIIEYVKVLRCLLQVCRNIMAGLLCSVCVFPSPLTDLAMAQP